MTYAVVLNDPIVYVQYSRFGIDDVIITDLEHQQAVVLDTSLQANKHWSLDGSQFLIDNQLLKSGEAARNIAPIGADADEADGGPYFDYHFIETANWLPDGSGFAYIDYHSGELKTTRLGETTATTIYTWPPTGCHADAYPPTEIYLYEQEFGHFDFSTKPVLMNTAFGLLLWLAPNSFARECLDDTIPELLLLTSTGQVVWSHTQSPDDIHLSGDGKLALFSYEDRASLVELATGAETTLSALAHEDVVGLNADGTQVFYATSVGTWVTPQPRNDAFDPIWPVDYIDRDGGYDGIVTLWQVPVDGSLQPRQLFRREGYAVGKLTVTPDDKALVFSVVTGNGPLISAINHHTSLGMLTRMTNAHVELIALSLDQQNIYVLWSVRGGQPDIGKGQFVVIGVSGF